MVGNEKDEQVVKLYTRKFMKNDFFPNVIWIYSKYLLSFQLF